MESLKTLKNAGAAWSPTNAAERWARRWAGKPLGLQRAKLRALALKQSEVFEALPAAVRALMEAPLEPSRQALIRSRLENPKLSERDRTILRARLNGTPYTYLAARLRISRQRVYQIEAGLLA